MTAIPVGWVFRHSPYTGATFQVHLTAADFVSEEHGYRLFANQSTIAAKARVSRGTVVKAIDRMERDGLLTLIEDRQSRGLPNIYRFEMPTDAAVTYDPEPLRAERASSKRTLARSGDKPCAPGAQPLRAERATDSKEIPIGSQQPSRAVDDESAASSSPQLSLVAESGDRTIDDEFEEWWLFYADGKRKIGKPEARAAFRSAVKRLGGWRKAEPVIVEGTNRWNRQWVQEKREPRHIPYPAKWLKQEHYEAVPEPIRTRRTR